MTSALEHFTEITQFAGRPILALGYVKPKLSAWEHVQNLIISSAVGLVARSLLKKEKRQYLALTESSLLLLEFADDELVDRSEFFLAQLEGGRSSIDESLVRVSFVYAGVSYTFDLMRYQIVDPQGAMVSDTQLMQQIGAMTARIGASIQARSLAA